MPLRSFRFDRDASSLPFKCPETIVLLGFPVHITDHVERSTFNDIFLAGTGYLSLRKFQTIGSFLQFGSVNVPGLCDDWLI